VVLHIPVQLSTQSPAIDVSQPSMSLIAALWMWPQITPSRPRSRTRVHHESSKLLDEAHRALDLALGGNRQRQKPEIRRCAAPSDSHTFRRTNSVTTSPRIATQRVARHLVESSPLQHGVAPASAGEVLCLLHQMDVAK